MDDILVSYEIGVNRLLNRIGKDHPRYTDVLVYKQRLLENISQSRLYKDTNESQAERARLIDALNKLALNTIGDSFLSLCGLLENSSHNFVENYLKQSLAEFRQVVNTTNKLRNPAEMYVPIELADSPDDLLRKPALEFLAQATHQGHAVLLLGNYGSGKSHLVKRLFFEQAERYLNLSSNPDIRIPILYPLRKLRGSKEDQIFIELVEHLRGQGFVGLDVETLKKLLEEGHFQCILDGFDEIPLVALYSDPMRELRRLYPLIKISRNQVIITSRGGVFAGIIPNTSIDGVTVKYLMPWSMDQWLKYLRISEQLGWGFTGGYYAFHERVTARSQLLELTKTPLYCHMLVETSDRIMQEEPVNLGCLYTLYIDKYLSTTVQDERGMVFDLPTKKECLSATAVGMLEKSQLYLTPQELSETLTKKLHHIAHSNLQNFVLASQDIRTYSLLIPDSQGNFSFSHKSFYEFFVAYHVYTQIMRSEGVDRLTFLAGTFLVDESTRFLSDLLSLQDRAELWNEIYAVITKSSTGQKTSAIEQSQTFLRNIALLILARENKLERAQLSKVDFSAVNFSSSILNGTKFNGCNFTGADLTRSDLRETQFRAANLRRVKLDYADLRGADLTEADIHDISCQGTLFEGACFDGVLLAKTDASRILSAVYQERANNNDVDDNWFTETLKNLQECTIA